jgi:hypothetical protein
VSPIAPTAAREVAATLMADVKAGRTEKVDVDDVIAALRDRSDCPTDPAEFEWLLQRTIDRFVNLAAS